MEKKIYLILADSAEAVCEIKGYLRGTIEEVQAYCEDLNKTNAEQGKEFVFLELTQLSANQRRKTATPFGFTTIQKTAEKWGVSKAYVYKLCQDGRISGAVLDETRWYIPEDAEKPSAKHTGFCSAKDMAKKWGIYEETVSRLCAEGEISGAERYGHIWRIPKEAENPLEGYVMISQLARQWGMSRSNASSFCLGGRIPGAKHIGRHWYVPADAQEPMNILTERKSGYISATKIAEKWSTTRNFVCKACREGRIPGAEYIDGRWHIPEDAEKPADRRRERKSNKFYR